MQEYAELEVQVLLLAVLLLAVPLLALPLLPLLPLLSQRLQRSVGCAR
jgi:hypothetical protein